MKTMIFHHPLPIQAAGQSGSRIRPARMLEAFQATGYETVQVTGFAEERREAMNRIFQDIKGGRKFDFCYSESSTMPYALTEPHHLPLWGEMDLNFFRRLRHSGVPVGVYYRDAQWMLPEYRTSGMRGIARDVARFFYRRELCRLRAESDVLYVPSPEFARWIGIQNDKTVKHLPPGCEIRPRGKRNMRSFAMLYVGGVSPPIYDVTPLFQLAEILHEERFLVVTRKEEWEELVRTARIPPNVQVVSNASNDLDQYFDDSDMFSLIIRSSEYFSIALPVKLFEALGRGVPILAFTGTAVSVFLSKERIGWCVDSPEKAAELVRHLRSSGAAELSAMERRMYESAASHTWESRAVQVGTEIIGMVRGGS